MLSPNSKANPFPTPPTERPTMPLQNYLIRCNSKGCSRVAEFKIASRWSDGVTGELKTYSLCCAECSPERFRDSLAKQAACPLADGETLARPGIYRLTAGERDRMLVRMTELEEKLLGS